MEAKLNEPALASLVEQLIDKTTAKLNQLAISFKIENPKLIQDDEDPNWTYAIIKVNIKGRVTSFNTIWDSLVREVYKGVAAEDAARVLITPS